MGHFGFFLMCAVCEPTPVFGVEHGKHVNHRDLKKLQMMAIYPLRLLIAAVILVCVNKQASSTKDEDEDEDEDKDFD